MDRKIKYPKEDRVKRTFRHSKSTRGIAPTRVLPEPLINTENTKFFNSEILLMSKRFHKYYKLHSKQKRKMPLYSCSMLINCFFKEVKMLLLENEAGVFLEGFGYFCFMKSPVRKIKKFVTAKAVFYGRYIYAMGAPYKPIFISIRKDGKLRDFTMDRGFNRGITNSGKYRASVKGKKYKMIFTILQNLYGRENLKAIVPNRRKIDNNN